MREAVAKRNTTHSLPCPAPDQTRLSPMAISRPFTITSMPRTSRVNPLEKSTNLGLLTSCPGRHGDGYADEADEKEWDSSSHFVSLIEARTEGEVRRVECEAYHFN